MRHSRNNVHKMVVPEAKTRFVPIRIEDKATGVTGDIISQLTDRQRQLLELVAADVTTSKALSRETGLTPGSVDATLMRAARVLGVRDRRAAADRYQALVEKSELGSEFRNPGFANRFKSGVSGLVRVGRKATRTGARAFRPPPIGGRKHALRWSEITFEIFRVALVGMVALSTLVLFVLGFFRTFS